MKLPSSSWEQREKLIGKAGISVSYDNGVLIATRGYSQDLLSLKYKNPANLFSVSSIEYDKVHRYLSGENEYNDIHFKCRGIKSFQSLLKFLNIIYQ